MNRALVLTVAAMLTAGCSGGTTAPQAVDTGKDACAVCRMIVSDLRFAAQVVAPGELPLFFDDLGCLADRLRERPLAAGAVAYVSDHRTRAWVPAASASAY